MNSRQMQIEFEKLIRNIDPKLEVDTAINSDTVFLFLSRAQESIIDTSFLSGSSLAENIEAIQKRSDILREIIKRTTLTNSDYDSQLADGGHKYTISQDDYWIYLNGTLYSNDLIVNDDGSDNKRVDIEIKTHFELKNIIRDIYDEPILENVPALLEQNKSLILYFDKEKEDSVGANIQDASIQIIYLAYPPAITIDNDSLLPSFMHKDVVKIAVDDFIINYKYKLSKSSNNGQ